MNSFMPIHKKMSEYYESVLESGHLSDVVLVAGGKELRVHKVILSAGSPVFAAMFAHSTTKEALENRVVIIDVDVEVLELMVRYIYTGKVGTLGLNAMDLLVAADKYQLDCLKSICKQQLLEQINAKSAADILIFADLYQVTELDTDDLKFQCLNYITRNAMEVMSSVGWKMVRERTALLDNLYENLQTKYSEALNVVNIYNEMNNSNENQEKSNRIDLISYATLLLACNESQLGYLLSICEQDLLPMITPESASNLLILADMHQVTELANQCLDYITDNATQVMATDGWKKIVADADFVVKLFERLSIKFPRISEEYIKIVDMLSAQ